MIKYFQYLGLPESLLLLFLTHFLDIDLLDNCKAL
jgi:hypothetical protein